MKKYLPVQLIFFLFIALPAQADDSGVESLRQTGKAFALVARNGGHFTRNGHPASEPQDGR